MNLDPETLDYAAQWHEDEARAWESVAKSRSGEARKIAEAQQQYHEGAAEYFRELIAELVTA